MCIPFPCPSALTSGIPGRKLQPCSECQTSTWPLGWWADWSSCWALNRSEVKCAQSTLNPTSAFMQSCLLSLTLCQMREKTEGKRRFHLNHGSAALTLAPQAVASGWEVFWVGSRADMLSENTCQWHAIKTHPWTPAAGRHQMAGDLSPTCLNNFTLAHDLCFQLCAQWPA